ncbi:MAG: DUF5050 domain-containing protein, partial [Lachnospiraceae bacterium]|nr:DUF5050 domain-containing protein [Lachnospiraceae bacterium]
MGTGRKILITAIITVIGGILITLGIISRLRRSVPQNPPGTVGNSSGNLNNGGLFCEYGNKVYFSNPYDNDFLYSMNLDGSNPSLVMNVPAKYINATKDFLYFNQVDSESGTVFGLAGSMHGIYRKKLTGGKEYKCLDKAVCGFATLINDTIYYQYSDEKETSFRSVSTDG